MLGLDRFKEIQQSLAQRSILRMYIICFFANRLRRSYLHGKHVFLQEIILLPSQLTTFQ